MIDKRVEDALDAGMVYITEDGIIAATDKARWIVPLLKFIGEITGTLEEYNEFLESMN